MRPPRCRAVRFPRSQRPIRSAALVPLLRGHPRVRWRAGAGTHLGGTVLDQLHAEHEAGASYMADDVVLLGKRMHARQQAVSHRGAVGLKALLLNHLHRPTPCLAPQPGPAPGRLLQRPQSLSPRQPVPASQRTDAVVPPQKCRSSATVALDGIAGNPGAGVRHHRPNNAKKIRFSWGSFSGLIP